MAQLYEGKDNCTYYQEVTSLYWPLQLSWARIGQGLNADYTSAVC